MTITMATARMTQTTMIVTNAVLPIPPSFLLSGETVVEELSTPTERSCCLVVTVSIGRQLYIAH